MSLIEALNITLELAEENSLENSNPLTGEPEELEMIKEQNEALKIVREHIETDVLKLYS